MRTGALILAFCLSILTGPGAAGAAAGSAPKVVVTLKPVHSLIAAVMAGVGEPRLLIRGSASPHTYSLRPSDAQALSRADLVFWVGEGMETFLEKPLESLAGGARIVELSKVPGVILLKIRAAGPWEPEAEAEEPAHHEGDVNLHIWLDPDNAVAIVKAAVAALSDADPGHAALYAKNGEGLIGRLTALDRELVSDLAPVKDAPFVVFHDAYQYFDRHYGLNAVGSITVNPERAPGASRLSAIRQKIMGLKAACVFSEPQFPPSVVRTVIEGTTARQGVLDPLGADIPAGPKAYFALMRGLASSLKTCLAVNS